MKHRNYRLSIERTANGMRKAGLIKASKKNRNVSFIGDALRQLYNLNPDISKTLEAVIHAEEWHWINSDRQCYFFEDAHTANNVSKGSYRVDDITPVFKENESFMLMLPKGFSINGNEKGSGVLVTIFDHVHRSSDVFAPFYNDALHKPAPNVEMVGDYGQWTISLAYQEDINTHEMMRCAIPNFRLNNILKFTTPEEYKEHLDATNEFDYFMGMDLEGAEYKYQFEIMRLVAGFLVYRHALPERVREGFPEGALKAANTPIIRNMQGSTISSPQGHREATAAHYRSWHFRQLLDERYYKGEHEDKPKGSRIIFVKDSMVNREVTPATVK